MTDSSKQTETGGKHTAGAFDVRNFIGALLGVYGVVLTLVGTFDGDATTNDGVDTGVNIDLWVGIALIVAAVVFVGWARLRPTVVDEAELERARHGLERPSH